MINLALGAFLLLGAVYTYIVGWVMKSTDCRPNTNGYDLLLIVWFIATIEFAGGIGIILGLG